MRRFWLPEWGWLLVFRHLKGSRARPAVRWMNRFAFLGVTVGVFAWISVVSVMAGLQGEIRQRVLDERAHLLWDGSPRADVEKGLEAFRAEAGDAVKGVEFILQTEGLLEVPTLRQRGRIMGAGVVVQGLSTAPAGSVSLGTELASQLGVGQGDELRILSAWKLEGVPWRSRVGSVFDSGFLESERAVVRMNRGELERWLGLEGSVSRVEIQLRDPMEAERWAPVAAKAFSVPFRTWRETQASLWYSLKLERFFMTVVVFFVVILAALSVHLALSVRVAEKVREIGLLNGLGASRSVLTRVFLTEGALIGVIGSTLGVLGSWIFCRVVSGYVRMPDFYYSAAIPVEWNWGTTFAMAGAALLTAVVASLGPARRASRVTAAEALRA